MLKPLVLIIIDGWGISPAWGGNAVSMARTPNFDTYWSKYPHTLLQASGAYVGLPGREMGNSEVGHLNIGAGRIVYQDISRISKAIKDGSFFENQVLRGACQHVMKHKSSLHMIGLVSDGGVHSHINHLFALIDLVKREGIDSFYIHCFCDGRDTAPTAALSYLSKLQEKLAQAGVGKIASVMGRYYAMDRDKRWDRTQKAYNTMVLGDDRTIEDPLAAVSHSYAEGKADEFIVPTTITKNNKPIGLISNNDSIIFFNFRADRARQLTECFVADTFKEFSRIKLSNLFFVTMIPYEYEITWPVNVAFPVPAEIKNCLAEVISNNGLKQLHVAETEKYAHITYFLNAAREKPYPGENRILIPSPKVSTYDLKPEMSAEKITQQVIKNLTKYDIIIVNFANPDMVGHSGNLKATIIGLEKVDDSLKRIVDQINKINGVAIITADHGNAEQMINPVTGEYHTEHTTSPVPLILISGTKKFRNLHPGVLASVAPTILDIMGIEKPKEMTGTSLFDVQKSIEPKPTATQKITQPHILKNIPQENLKLDNNSS